MKIIPPSEYVAMSRLTEAFGVSFWKRPEAGALLRQTEAALKVGHVVLMQSFQNHIVVATRVDGKREF